MGADNEIIVALEFGTSAIRGIAGKKKADGSIQILDIEQEYVTDAIQRGIIYNIDKTTQAITNIVQRMGERLNTQIQRAYVGIGGQSLHTAGNFISRGLETKVKITPELIDNLMDNNRATQYTDSVIHPSGIRYWQSHYYRSRRYTDRANRSSLHECCSEELFAGKHSKVHEIGRYRNCRYAHLTTYAG